jgi:thymidylate synthase
LPALDGFASYSFLTHLIAHFCELEAEDFVYFLGNAHIYEEHLEILQTQLQRHPFSFPRISLNTRHENIEDYDWKDIEWIEPYQCHSALKMEMKA